MAKVNVQQNETKRTVRLTLHAQRNHMFREFGRDAFKALVGFQFGRWLIQAVDIFDHDLPGEVTFTLVGYGDALDLMDSFSFDTSKEQLG